MLWNKKSSGSSSSLPSAEAELVLAIQALIGDLRASVRYALRLPNDSTDEDGQRVEAWAEHLLSNAPAPDSLTSSGELEIASREARSRDFRGVLSFLVARRRLEHEYATRTLAELRDTIGAFIHRLKHSFTEDSSDDERFESELERLRSAAEHPSVDELRRVAHDVANSIEDLMQARRARHIQRANELGRRVAALGRELEVARTEASIDPMTGLQNRRSFDAFTARIVERALSEDSAILLMIDIDHFKRINDTYGHPVGDEVIRRFAKCLVTTFLRRSDFVARYGGEEFAVVLTQTPLADALTLAERLQKSLAAMPIRELDEETITISIGVSAIHPADSPDTWVSRADRALYEAKRRGRDRITVAEPAGRQSNT